MQKNNERLIMMIHKLINHNPGYLKKGPIFIAEKIQVDITDEIVGVIKNALKLIRKEKAKELDKENNRAENIIKERIKEDGNTVFQFAKVGKPIPEFLKEKEELVFTNEDLSKRVLVVGDLHVPFENKEYLEFCKKQYKEFNCNKVVFIGDIVDNCFSSFHTVNADGFGAGEELDRAISHLKNWYLTFPEATVIIGNHDRLAYRKAFAGGVSARWIRNYNDVLEVPNWNFEEKEVIDDVLYIHGEAGTARTKAKDISQSVVQGHLHSQAYVEFINNRIFAMQVGTGINDNEYAFNYNKAGKESILSCGIVLNGKQPILIKM